MNTAAWILAVTAAALPLGPCAEPVTPVRSLDTQRFAGTWYELARLPGQPQAECERDVTTHYAPRADGTLQVVRSCRTPTGRVATDVGRAWAQGADTRHAARWTLSFMPRWLQWLPLAKGDHWVVMLDPAYRFAVISEPKRRSLWVMARSPALPADDLGRIVDRLAAEGYPTEQLVLTRQSAVVQRIGPDQAVPFTGRPRLMVRHAAAPDAA